MAYLSRVSKKMLHRFTPNTRTKHKMKVDAALNTVRECRRNGTVFSAVEARTPWERTAHRHRGANVPKHNFCGFKVRSVDQMKEPGFPTHWH